MRAENFALRRDEIALLRHKTVCREIGHVVTARNKADVLRIVLVCQRETALFGKLAHGLLIFDRAERQKRVR